MVKIVDGLSHSRRLKIRDSAVLYYYLPRHVRESAGRARCAVRRVAPRFTCTTFVLSSQLILIVVSSRLVLVVSSQLVPVLGFSVGSRSQVLVLSSPLILVLSSQLVPALSSPLILVLSSQLVLVLISSQLVSVVPFSVLTELVLVPR